MTETTAGENERGDDPPRGRASPWQEDQPSRIETINALRDLGASILSSVTPPAAAATDSSLSNLLAAIGEDVARDTSAASHAIMQEFAGKIAQARTLPRDQRRAAIADIKRERKAAIAAVRSKAALERAARRAAAMQIHGKPPGPK